MSRQRFFRLADELIDLVDRHHGPQASGPTGRELAKKAVAKRVEEFVKREERRSERERNDPRPTPLARMKPKAK